jgi:hypothetical protein
MPALPPLGQMTDYFRPRSVSGLRHTRRRLTHRCLTFRRDFIRPQHLDDGSELDWQAAGKTPTQALHALVTCWLQRLGDSALFLGHELVSVECLGPCTDEELQTLETETAPVAVTVPSSVSSQLPDQGSDQGTDPGDVELEVSRIGDTSKMRRVVLRGK